MVWSIFLATVEVEMQFQTFLLVILFGNRKIYFDLI